MRSNIYKVIFLQLTIVCLLFGYYIAVNTVLRDVALPNLWFEGESYSFATQDGSIAGRYNSKLPHKVALVIDNYSYIIPLSESGIRVAVEDDLVNYGKGNDFAEVIIEGFSLIGGKEIEVTYQYDESVILGYLGIDVSGINENGRYECADISGIQFSIDHSILYDNLVEALDKSYSELDWGSLAINESSDLMIRKCRDFTNTKDLIVSSMSNLTNEHWSNYFDAEYKYPDIEWSMNVPSFEYLLDSIAQSTNIPPSEGKYELVGDKIYLYEPYATGYLLDKSSTIASVSSWLNNTQGEIPMIYYEVNPEVTSFNKEIIDITEFGATEVDVVAVGDLMFHSSQNTAAYNSSTKRYDYKGMFAKVKDNISSVDVALGNYETVSRDDIAPKGFPRFNTPSESLEAISWAGFDYLATSNNHTIDQGRKGIVDTIKNIENNGMKAFGTKSRDDGGKVLVEEINGINIAFLSYTYGFNGLDYLLSSNERNYMVNKINDERIKADINTAKSNGAEFIISYVHWGREYSRKQNTYQTSLARKMTTWGVDVIIGSHPHVIQPMERYEYKGRDKLVYYSLGNFISNQRYIYNRNRFKYTEDGVIVSFSVRKDFTTGEIEITQDGYTSTWVNRGYKSGKVFFEVLPINKYINSSEYSRSIRSRMEVSKENTQSVLR